MRMWYNVRLKFTVMTLIAVVLTAAAGNIGVAHTVEAAGGNEMRTDYAVSGNGMIWLEEGSGGLKKLMYRNTATGQQVQLTDGSRAVDAPSINGDWIVWADKGSESPGSLNWYIYGYNLVSGVQKQLSRTAGVYGNPSADEDGAVWYDRSGRGEMIYRDFITGSEFSLGEGRFPVLANGIVVFKNARDGGLSMLQLSNGIQKRLITLGGSNYVDWFVFNGTHVLAREHYSTGTAQYVLIQVADVATPVPQYVASPVSRGQVYDVMSIGDGHAVFMQSEGGVLTVKSIHLNTSKVTSHSAPAAMEQVIGIRNGKLLYAGSDGATQELALEQTSGGSNPGSGGGNGDGNGNGDNGGNGNSGEDGSSGSGEGRDESVAFVDAQGGFVEVANGDAKAVFGPGTFADRTKVSLGRNEAGSMPLLDEQGKAMQLASPAWELNSENSLLKPAELTIRFTAGKGWEKDAEKLGIYRWTEGLGQGKNGYWSYVGGASRTRDGFVQTEVSEPGIYAIMMRQIAFEDLNGHWARKSIEVLAARGIVNGKSDKLYAPEASVTRAEFAKLLVGAMGLKPFEGTKTSFADVKRGDWHFGYVEAAAAAGLVQGDAGKFRPNDAVTREQMTVMLMRAIESMDTHDVQGELIVGNETKTADTQKEAEANKSASTEQVLLPYADGDQVSGWAREAVASAIEAGLIQGSGHKLSPQGLTTRAQAGTVIYRLLDRLNKL